MGGRIYDEAPVFCFTSDVDWASDDVWKSLHRLFVGYGIKPTYFITHGSGFLEGLKREGGAGLGIHPNFAPGSSQGETLEEIIDYCLSLVPGARAARSHQYYDENAVSYMLYEKGIRFDSSVCTRVEPGIKPLTLNSGIVRIPVFWEDGSYSEYASDWKLNTLKPRIETCGIKTFDLHPMNVVLNVPDRPFYHRLKEDFPGEKWSELTRDQIETLRFRGRGPLT
ncbi:MAG: hypothetical protein AB1742_04265, partial [bacterium]